MDICLSSITASTIKQYNGGLKQWWLYRKNNNLKLFSTSVPEVLEFFTLHFKKGASFVVLSSYRAALTQILSSELLSDIRIKRFFKGIHSLRPTPPKYSHTWDPAIVLSYIRKMSNSPLSLENLTYKLAILVALATGQRIQTLVNIEVENIIQLQERIEIKIPNRIKTTSKGRIQPTLILPFFDLDEKICPAKTLLSYLDMTKEFRGTTKNLFITVKRPYHSATAQTIGRWLKHILKLSGLDTTLFTAHTTRHASTSAAARNGVSYDTIRLAAGWTKKSSAFAQFYNRPIKEDSNFAVTVLNS